MMENLKCALFNLHYSKGGYGFFGDFYTEGNELFAKHVNVTLKACDDQIDVFFENPSDRYSRRCDYLTRENTFKRFQSPDAAIEYLHYLIRATNDVRFEMYHYFMFKLQEIGIESNYWFFDYTFDHSNSVDNKVTRQIRNSRIFPEFIKSFFLKFVKNRWFRKFVIRPDKLDLEHLILNTGVSDLKKKGLELDFAIQIELYQNNTCRLFFIPPEVLWNEGKVCPETQLHQALDYLQKLNCCEYDKIPIEETSVY